MTLSLGRNQNTGVSSGVNCDLGLGLLEPRPMAGNHTFGLHRWAGRCWELEHFLLGLWAQGMSSKTEEEGGRIADCLPKPKRSQLPAHAALKQSVLSL